MDTTDISDYPHPVIAKEGWLFISISLVSFFILIFLEKYLLSSFFLFISFFTIQFFRDPARSTEAKEDEICSPADGRIVFVGNDSNPTSGEKNLKISIFMNVFNVHSNRSPISGTIKEVKYIPGQFFNAEIDKASVKNERNSVVITDRFGRTLTCVQIAGLIARRICCYVKPNDNVLRGSRFGFIRFGSRVDIFLPEDSSPLVAVGEKIYAHSSAIAIWPKNT